MCVAYTLSLSVSLSVLDRCNMSIFCWWWLVGRGLFFPLLFCPLISRPRTKRTRTAGTADVFFFIFVVRVKSVLSSSPQNKGVLSSFSVNMSRSLQNKDGLSLYFALPFHFHPVSARRRPYFRLGSSTRGPCIVYTNGCRVPTSNTQPCFPSLP